MVRPMRLMLTCLGVFAISLTLLSPASAQDSARIHLLHGIPDVDVDVVVDGEAVFSDFSFGDTQDLGALAGTTLSDLQVKVAGTDDVAIDGGDVELPASGNYTIIAHLDAEGTPTLGVFENDTSNTAAGEGRLTVRHTAAAPEVDILADGNAIFEGVANGAGGSADVPAATYSATVVPAGTTEPVVIGPADLGVEEGKQLIVYAVGSLDGESLTVLTETIDGLHSAPSRVDTGNSLPLAQSLGFGAVALALGASILLSGTGVLVARRARS